MSGNPEHHILADRQILYECSVYRRCRKELDIGAKIVSSSLAGAAVSAGHSRFNCNTVSDDCFGYLISCGNNNSCTFMPQNNRLLHYKPPDPAMLIVVQIRAAYANGHNLDEHFMIANLRYRHLLNYDAPGFVHDRCFHGQGQLILSCDL
ncbi:hypothetical protein D3C72_1933210 [compost metagenome]